LIVQTVSQNFAAGANARGERATVVLFPFCTCIGGVWAIDLWLRFIGGLQAWVVREIRVARSSWQYLAQGRYEIHKLPVLVLVIVLEISSDH